MQTPPRAARRTVAASVAVAALAAGSVAVVSTSGTPSPATAAPIELRRETLELPQGYVSGAAVGIAYSTQVAGTGRFWTGTPTGPKSRTRALVWPHWDAAPIVLPLPPDATSSVAADINTNAEIVGHVETPSGVKAIKWDASRKAILLAPTESRPTRAIGVNTEGEVVGQVCDCTPTRTAWKPARFVGGAALPVDGVDEGSLSDIGDKAYGSRIVGHRSGQLFETDSASQGIRALPGQALNPHAPATDRYGHRIAGVTNGKVVVWTLSSLSRPEWKVNPLEPQPAGARRTVTDISYYGTAVAGYTEDSSGRRRGFWYANGTLYELPPGDAHHSVANGVNDSYVVGSVSPAGGFERPTLWALPLPPSPNP